MPSTPRFRLTTALALLPAFIALSAHAGPALPPPAGYAASDLIFEDQFTSATLDASKWNPWLGDDLYGRWGNAHGNVLPSPYSGPNCSSDGPAYQVNDPFPYGHSRNTTGNHLVGGDGTLRIIAAPNTYWTGYCWLYQWPTAAITSYGHAYIPAEGGYAQWRAKMPDSSAGGWFGLWLMSANGAEIDIQESGYLWGSSPVNNVMAMNYHGGGTQIIHNTGIDLSAAYHVYGVEIRPGTSIKMYLDGAEVGQYTNNVPRSAAYQLLIDLEIANGNAYQWHSVAPPAGKRGSRGTGAIEGQVNDVQIYGLPKAPPPDGGLTAPSVPNGLQASIAGNAVDLTWTASTGPSGVYGYDIYRKIASDGGPPGYLAFSTSPRYSDRSVEGGKTYSYQVMAYAKKGSETAGSAFSEPLIVAVLGTGSVVTATTPQSCAVPAGTTGTVTEGPSAEGKWLVQFPACTLWVDAAALQGSTTRR